LTSPTGPGDALDRGPVAVTRLDAIGVVVNTQAAARSSRKDVEAVARTQPPSTGERTRRMLPLWTSRRDASVPRPSKTITARALRRSAGPQPESRRRHLGSLLQMLDSSGGCPDRSIAQIVTHSPTTSDERNSFSSHPSVPTFISAINHSRPRNSESAKWAM